MSSTDSPQVKLLQCMLEVFFALEWTTMGTIMMAVVEVFATVTSFLGWCACWLFSSRNWDECRELYSYSPGDSMRAHLKTLKKKWKEACSHLASD